MSDFSAEQREAEEAQLRELAQELKDLTATTAGSGHIDTITGFAEQAENYADMIRDAESLELAGEIAAKAATKREQWSQLKDMLLYATLVEGPDGAARAKEIEDAALEEAEGKIRQVAVALRAVSGRGNTTVFRQIADVATEAETCLADFQAAENTEDKLAVFERFETAKVGWLSQMETMHTNVSADDTESNAPTDAPDDADNTVCEFVSDSAACQTSCRAIEGDGDWGSFGTGNFNANNWSFGGSGGYCVSEASSVTCAAADPATSSTSSTNGKKQLQEAKELTSQVKAAGTENLATADKTVITEMPATPEEAHNKLVAYLLDEEEGFMVTLRKSVAAIKEDDRFEGAYEDASKFLEQMEIAVVAVAPASSSKTFTDDLAGQEEKMMETVQPYRSAQFASLAAKKHAFNLRKYDLYIAKGRMPKLAAEHEDLYDCAEAGVQISEFLRRHAQGRVMDMVTGLVAAIPSTAKTAVTA